MALNLEMLPFLAMVDQPPQEEDFLRDIVATLAGETVQVTGLVHCLAGVTGPSALGCHRAALLLSHLSCRSVALRT